MKLDNLRKQIVSFMTSKNIFLLWICIVFLLVIILYNFLKYLNVIEGLTDLPVITVSSSPVKQIIIWGGTDFLQISNLRIYDSNGTEIPYSETGDNKVSNTKGKYNTPSGLDKLNDGDKNSCFISGSGGDTLTITLKNPTKISKMTVRNRTDCCQTRLNAYTVYLIDESNILIASQTLITPELNLNVSDYTAVYKFVPPNSGPKGDKGDKGDKGSNGDKGDAGPAGPTGPAGPAGKDGEDGDGGPAGPAGPEGPEGPAGAQGPQGQQGVQGLSGNAGIQGQLGPTGPSGPAGYGARGSQGSQDSQTHVSGSYLQIVDTFAVQESFCDTISAVSGPASYL